MDFVVQDVANLGFVENQTPDVNLFKNCRVIDLISTDYSSIDIIDFPNLKRLRVQSCNALTHFHVKNCPLLEVIDCSFCRSLDTDNFKLENLPNLLCLNISYTGIQFITTSLSSLKCLLSKNTNLVIDPALLPNLENLELGSFYSDEFSYIYTLQSLNRLQLYFNRLTEIDLSRLASLPNLEYLYLKNASVTSNDFPRSTNLKLLFLRSCKVSKDFSVPVPHVYADKNIIGLPTIPTDFPKWADSYRLLYGPWGIPPCDRTSPTPLVPSTRRIPDMNVEQALDSILGAVLGSALGDALGVKSEFNKRSVLMFELNTPLDIIWSHLLYVRNSPYFMFGSSTDDTDQSVFIMRSLLSGKPDIKKFASLMKEWSQSGIVEHRQGYCYDIGTTTSAAVNHPNFLKDPLTASKSAYKSYKGSGNGSAMRTAPVGCFDFWNEKEVKNNAKLFGSATHYHEDCNCAAVLISLLVSRFIQQRAGLIDGFDIEETVKESISFTKCKDHQLLHQNDLDKLKLNGSESGWAITAASAALVCLRNNWSYEEALTKLISYGGDADTNAAIAGAVLGAKYGFKAIPKRLMKYLFNGSWIYKELEKMIAVMGIEPPPSPFNELSYE
ncbi:ADP-ribosylglycohydrolase family protein [Histomonas meleagridis]|uniref:ADP-ribosylglycohydrolase family protein n=1 Tax=Histomonas meleagridis TaxID=135588 RepID=UPI00355A8E79|nr:ADP-ribosylglycohydrolase family protein [Histomonas meleagridis]KAH0804172.1 ADP-ribosylglycohydrolase family protein [Histomonas meleagridis]